MALRPFLSFFLLGWMCDLVPGLGGEVKSAEHFLFDCPVYQAQRQKLREKLTSDPDAAANCQILDGQI